MFIGHLFVVLMHTTLSLNIGTLFTEPTVENTDG